MAALQKIYNNFQFFFNLLRIIVGVILVVLMGNDYLCEIEENEPIWCEDKKKKDERLQYCFGLCIFISVLRIILAL